MINLELVEEIQKNLEYAMKKIREHAQGSQEYCYWQGRKDGLRVSLSLALEGRNAVYEKLITGSEYAKTTDEELGIIK